MPEIPILDDDYWTALEILSEANAQHVFQIAYHRDFTLWKPSYSRPCGVAKSFEAASWDQISQSGLGVDMGWLRTDRSAAGYARPSPPAARSPR